MDRSGSYSFRDQNVDNSGGDGISENFLVLDVMKVQRIRNVLSKVSEKKRLVNSTTSHCFSINLEAKLV